MYPLFDLGDIDMDKNEVKAWALVVSAVLGAVLAAERVVEKTYNLYCRFAPTKKRGNGQTDSNEESIS